jgi:ABC-2 type transport system ATP-binding protein
MKIIEAKNVCMTFGETIVLEAISISVEKGEVYGLFGPNGAGKTTLLKILTGQIQPDFGEITTMGASMNDPIEIKRRVGIVPEAETPPTFLTVYETLELSCKLRGLENAYEHVCKWIDFFELGGKKDILCRDLSKGERQKVMLASAFIHEPQVLFLDEPFINLDPIYQRKVRNYLQNLTREGRTIFISTHILEMAERLCTRIAVIHLGRIVNEQYMDYQGGDHLEDIFMRAVEEGNLS